MRTAGSTSPNSPSTTSTPARSRRASAASAFSKTPTATWSTTRALSSRPTCRCATAVVCWNGGVYAASAPDLLYLKDTDGDGKADVRRVVFTGFGKDIAGESIMNSFRWGLDNRFHVSTNNAGGDVSRAAEPRGKAVSVRGQGFVFDPRGETFALTGGGGQHGMSMDDWGRTYVCANSEPFPLVMYDSRYLARNPYLHAPPAAVNVAPAGKFTKLYRTSPVEPWRVLRTRLRTQGIVPGSDEGGSPSGFFTGATGVTVYRGDAFPAEFHGNLFVGDVSNNIVHRAVPVQNGVLVTARSAEVGREFLASSDNVFRPVQMANGPDGCLWVIDMYRELIEGAAFLPPVILEHLDVGSGVRPRPHLAAWYLMGTRHPWYRGWAKRRRPSSSRCSSTRTAGTATPRRDCYTSGRTAPPSSRYASSQPGPVRRWDEHTPCTP